MERISQHMERADEAGMVPSPNWRAIIGIQDLVYLRRSWREAVDKRRGTLEELIAEEADLLSIREARDYLFEAEDRLEEYDRAYYLWKDEFLSRNEQTRARQEEEESVL